MGLKYENLIPEVRAFMIEEIDMDAKTDKLYLSTYLTQSGQGNWADLLKSAASVGTDDTLAAAITQRGFLVRQIQKTSVKGNVFWSALPHGANHTLAEGEFNRFFCRALARHAIATGLPRLEVYRAKQVAQPRAESQTKIGLLVDPTVVLIDLRNSHGVEPALGIPPGPNSGITLRIPKT